VGTVTTAECEARLFDLSIPKILILLVLGLMIFGPERLPKLAAQAGQALRDLRRLADNAKADLSESLGPEFRDFDLNDLNPRSLVRKHLLDDLPKKDDFDWAGLTETGQEPVRVPPQVFPLEAGEIPPYDAEAT
jgi:sec-independent protein translocase protein TatB